MVLIVLPRNEPRRVGDRRDALGDVGPVTFGAIHLFDRAAIPERIPSVAIFMPAVRAYRKVSVFGVVIHFVSCLVYWEIFQRRNHARLPQSGALGRSAEIRHALDRR